MNTMRWIGGLALVLLLSAAPAWALPDAAGGSAAAKNDDASKFFETKIRPVLVSNCYSCHSAGAKSLKGDLKLDSLQAMLDGGASGPAVVPGDTKQSILIDAISYTDKDLQMPPKGKLPDPVIADFTNWVKSGAAWPGKGGAGGAMAGTTTQPGGDMMAGGMGGMPAASPAQAVSGDAAGPGTPGWTSPQQARYQKLIKDHWAWQPLALQPIPGVSNPAWPKSDVDRFVMAAWDDKELKPVADADRTTLIRRVTFDLTGLPPSPAEIKAFVNDRSPGAFAKVVDRLLDSSQFGETWGRHWLDVARYSESTGSSRNFPYTQAWRYRNYVIASFNADKPYNQFITEQVAGDLLAYTSPEQHNTQEIATGFLAMGVKDLNEGNRAKFEMDVVDEQIDVMSRSMLALTMGCARCHDHKFDPIPTADYYALAGIFSSTHILAGVESKRDMRRGTMSDELIQLDPVASNNGQPIQADPKQIAALQDQIQQAQAQIDRLKNGNGPLVSQLTQIQKQRLITQRQQTIQVLTADLESLKSGSFATKAMGVEDARPVDDRICVHGEVTDLGAVVPRGFTTLISLGPEPSISQSESGRLELAQWLTSRDNPLVSRVIVNRIWQHLFGQGIVRTVDNFGSTGETPADPQLLDYLAEDFMDNHWSVKDMVRKLVLSRSYQLSTTNDKSDFAIDPDNRLCWHMQAKRLEAEEIRDAMLVASGKMDLTPPVGSPVMTLPQQEIRDNAVTAKGKKRGTDGEGLDDDMTHRSVYLPILRDMLPPVLEVFDFAEPSMVMGLRDTTTVPTQALYMLNDPFVLDESDAMADNLLNQRNISSYARVDLAYQLTLGRLPTSTEEHAAMRFLGEYGYADAYVYKGKSDPRLAAWSGLCQALFTSALFRFLN
jgi:cytochrome c553